MSMLIEISYLIKPSRCRVVAWSVEAGRIHRVVAWSVEVGRIHRVVAWSVEAGRIHKLYKMNNCCIS